MLTELRKILVEVAGIEPASKILIFKNTTCFFTFLVFARYTEVIKCIMHRLSCYVASYGKRLYVLAQLIVNYLVSNTISIFQKQGIMQLVRNR